MTNFDSIFLGSILGAILIFLGGAIGAVIHTEYRISVAPDPVATACALGKTNACMVLLQRK